MPRAPRLLLAALLARPGLAGMCPGGFDQEGAFPAEWEIPQWPSDLTQEQAGELLTVSFAGFTLPELNEDFLEGPGDRFLVQGQKTYWQASGEYFLYWCERFRKWRIAGISGFSKIKWGECLAYASDAYPNRDILNKSLIKTWLEVEKGAWQVRDEAGVSAFGRLSEFAAKREAELAAQKGEAPKEGEEEEAAEDGSCSPGAEGEPGVDGEKSTCPVMPVVRKGVAKVKEKVAEAREIAGKWVARLFPQLMAPEEAAPAEGAADSASKTEEAPSEAAEKAASAPGAGTEEAGR